MMNEIMVQVVSGYGADEKAKWITLPAADLAEQVQEILGDEKNYRVNDYVAPFPVCESANLVALNAIASRLTGFDLARFTYLVNQGYDWDFAFQNYEEVTCYRDMSLFEVAEGMVHEGLSQHIEGITSEWLACDLGVDGYCETSEGVLYF